MAEIDQFYAPDVDTLVNANLRVRRNGLLLRGVPNPNTTKDSDHYVYARALALNLVPAYQNTVIMGDQMMPDTASGERLVRWLNIFGLTPLTAAGASGNVILTTSTTTLVPVDSRLIDDVGQVYRVTVGGNYNDGDPIPVIGESTGESTNHAAGDILQWVDQPAFADPLAEVASPGLIGGADTDEDEDSRSLLYSHLRNPAGGGNWSQIIQWAKAASSSVKSAFVYPALNGPATVGLVLLGELTYDAVNGFTREVSSTVRQIVHDYVAAQLPEHADLTTVTPTDAGATPDVNASFSLGLSLPAAKGAGGPGGGWVDAVPWPVLNGTATRCTVSVVTDSTHLILTSDDSGTTPSATGLQDGVTQIAWFSPASYADGQAAIITATVTAHGGTTGALTVTLSAPFTGVLVGDYVFPNAENIEVYAQALLTAMGDLGPAQWTTLPATVPRAYRHPLVQRQQPSDLTSALLKPVVDSGDEVEDAQYLYRLATTPGVVSTTTDSPFVFVPSRFGMYDKIP
jgi:hypothetical protein